MEETQFQNRRQFQKVSRIEPKRCYVVSQVMRKMDRGTGRYLEELTTNEFQQRLERAKKEVLALSEEELDLKISTENYPKRLKGYNSVAWYKGIVHPNEIGVWKGAGGLPVSWTQGSLSDTVRQVAQAMHGKGERIAARAKRAIPRMMKHLDSIEREKYLLPIILPGATNGRGVRGKPYKAFQFMLGDIDDGCMRSITMVADGRTEFYAYVGIKE